MRNKASVLMKSAPSVSKKQQKFMAMVHATQQGDIKPPSKEVAEVAKTMKPGDARDFAATKTKGLPETKEDKQSALGSAFARGFSHECKRLGLDKDAMAAAYVRHQLRCQGAKNVKTGSATPCSEPAHIISKDTDFYKIGIATGFPGYLTSPWFSMPRAAEAKGVYKTRGEESPSFMVRHPVGGPVVGMLGAGALGALLGAITGGRGIDAVAGAGVGTQLGAGAGALISDVWQQHRVNQAMKDLVTRYPELKSLLYPDKKHPITGEKEAAWRAAFNRGFLLEGRRLGLMADNCKKEGNYAVGSQLAVSESKPVDSYKKSSGIDPVWVCKACGHQQKDVGAPCAACGSASVEAAEFDPELAAKESQAFAKGFATKCSELGLTGAQFRAVAEMANDWLQKRSEVFKNQLEGSEGGSETANSAALSPTKAQIPVSGAHLGVAKDAPTAFMTLLMKRRMKEQGKGGQELASLSPQTIYRQPANRMAIHNVAQHRRK